MKTLLLSAALLLASASSYAQAAKPASETPFKKANTVILVTTDSASVAIKKLGQIMVSKGYTIKKLDTDFNTLLTDPKSIKGAGLSNHVVLRVAPTANGLALSGELISNMSHMAPGMDNVTVRISSSGKDPQGYFRQLIDIASAYPGSRLQYAQE